MDLPDLPVEIRAPRVWPLMSDGHLVVLLHHPQRPVMLLTQMTLGVGEGHPHGLGLNRLILQPAQEVHTIELLADLVVIVQQREGATVLNGNSVKER